jgi:hypothetical protein
MGWGELASAGGSPTFTVKLYNGTTLLDTQTTTQPLNANSFAYWMLWSDTGARPEFGGVMESTTPIDFAPVNAGTFAGKIAITINQGSVGNITTGDISPILQTAQFWDPINIETISYDADGSSAGWFAPDIQVSLGDESGTVPEPGSFELIGLGVLVFATWRHRRSRGHAPCHLPVV